MRFAYADPPYIGRDTTRLYKGHPDNAGAVDQEALIARLCDEYPDGWALSAGSKYLKRLLSWCPDDVRILAWCKPAPMLHTNVFPTYSWEAVLMRGGRRPEFDGPVLDFIVANQPGGWYLKDWPYPGGKPPAFCTWLFRCLGARSGDELDDLFPGSGAVSAAWASFVAQPGLWNGVPA